MSTRLFNKGLLLLPQLITNRSVSSSIPSKNWKVLTVGAGKLIAGQAQKSLLAAGYKNVKVLGIHNTKESDQEFAAALKEQQWDAIAFGGHVNGYDQSYPFDNPEIPTERGEILLWFNRALNIVHELAPKAKIILVKGPSDISDAIQRVLGNDKEAKQ